MTDRRTQRGFTLTEMMVVIAIIGVLVTLAIVYIRPQAKTVDIANRVGDLVHEASRRAVQLGPVRPDVVQASLNAGNSQYVARARTRIVATGAANSSPVFNVERLVEDPLPANTASWVQTLTYTTDPAVIGKDWSPGIGSHSVLSGTLQTTWTTLKIFCAPDGSCQPFSLFFQNAHDPPGSLNFQARLSVLPLGGAILTRSDWN